MEYYAKSQKKILDVQKQQKIAEEFQTEKEQLKPYNKAPNGITGLETAFSLSYQTFGLDLALEKMAYTPRRILSINPKREIEVDLDEKWVVDGRKFNSKCKITPYQGMELKGKIL